MGSRNDRAWMPRVNQLDLNPSNSVNGSHIRHIRPIPHADPFARTVTSAAIATGPRKTPTNPSDC